VVGFWSFLCCSNLLQKSPASYAPGQHVGVDSIALTDSGFNITLNRTKTLQFNECQLAIPLVAIPGSNLCPFDAVRAMWQLCQASSGVSLFCYSSRGRPTPLVHSRFNKLLKSFCKAAGLNPRLFSGHSMRKGGATCALLAGVSETLVKLQGDRLEVRCCNMHFLVDNTRRGLIWREDN
jgi:hypothetical protein